MVRIELEEEEEDALLTSALRKQEFAIYEIEEQDNVWDEIAEWFQGRGGSLKTIHKHISSSHHK